MDPFLLGARVILTGSFLLNFGCQLYGMLATPKEVADENRFAFSPHPLFIVAAFAAQIVLQLYWVVIWFIVTHKYPQLDDVLPDEISKVDQEALAQPDDTGGAWPLEIQLVYTPFYALGVLLMAACMFFRMKEWFWAAQVMVTINIVIQALIILPFSEFRSFGENLPTHLVAMAFTGISVLEFLDNGAVALGYSGPPSVPVQILTVVLFIFLALYTDIIFGLCIFYDALALLVGQPTWRPALQTAVGLLGVLIPVRYGYLWLTDEDL
ncbi:hypothetical protein BU15DRAFT_70689 [Melanogaster broomeanus]|nr:hypothetical protein BU15DRAFT_70689 [Melanogaster broomeanus]